MKKLHEDPLISIEHAWKTINSLVLRLEEIEEEKISLLDILNESMNISEILWKIKFGKIISLEEKLTIMSFIVKWTTRVWSPKLMDFFKNIMYPNGGMWSDLSSFIMHYSLVIDADEIIEDNNNPQFNNDGLIPIYKDGKAGLINKMMQKVLEPDKYEGVICCGRNRYTRFGIICISHTYDTGISHDIFLRKWWDVHEVKFNELYNYNFVSCFDDDNVWIISKWNSVFSFVCLLDDGQDFKIEEFGGKLEINEESAKQWFDEYNSFYTDTITYRKRYDKLSWNMIWIDAFQLSRNGKEDKIENRCRNKVK